MTTQNSLFGEMEAPIPEQFKSDLVAQAKAYASSPLQSEFAKLLEKIEVCGHQLQDLEQLHSQYHAKFGQILPALEKEQDAVLRQIALFLHERLQRPERGKTASLTASHRKAMARMIVSYSFDFAMQGDEQVRTIHDLYSNESIDDLKRSDLDQLRSMLNEAGVELPEQSDQSSPEQMIKEALSAAQEKMAQQEAQQEKIQAQRDARRDEKRSARAKLDSKTQAKLSRQEQAAKDAQSALKNIYRQLARQLHPDRAEGEQQRALNHDLMSEANSAYERQDLLALLKLQIKAAQIDASAMRTVHEDTLKNWVALLRAQAKDLSREYTELEIQMYQQFGVPRRLSLTATNLNRTLHQAMQEGQAELDLMRRDLELLKNDADLKRWIKATSKLMPSNAVRLEEAFLDAMLFEQMMGSAMRQTKKNKR